MKNLASIFTNATCDYLSILNYFRFGPTSCKGTRLATYLGLSYDVLKKRIGMMNQLIATPLFTISEGIISIDITSFKSVFQLYQHVLKEVPELIMLEQVVFQKNEKLVALALDYPFAVSSLSKARHNILDFLTDQIKLTKPTKEKCESNWLYFYFVISLERTLIEVYRNKLSVSLPLSFPIHFKLAIKTLLENPHFSYGQSLTYSLRNKHNYHSLELLIDLLTEFPIERTNFVDYFFTILSMKDIKTEHERNFLLYASYVLLLWHYDLSPYQLIKLSPFSECPANTKDNFSKQVQKMQKNLSLPESAFYNAFFSKLYRQYLFEQQVFIF